MILKPLTACLTLLGFLSTMATEKKGHGEDLRLRGTSKVVFATKSEGASVLTTRDEFVSRLSPFDRSARLKSEQAVDEKTYLQFIGEQTLDWREEEKQLVTTAFEAINQKLTQLKMQLPATILIIKTTGAEEGNAAYTRGNAIILPQSKVGGEAKGNLTNLMTHELFHVLSRHDASLREKLYQLLGFERCNELQLPPDLARKRITNPDAPINDHFIKIKLGDREVPAIPVLYANAENYDKQRGGEFFNYLVFELLVVDASAGNVGTHPQLKEGLPILVKPNKAVGFIEQVGRNTQYLIHPDEILADNFVMLVTGTGKVNSPEILARIAAAFE